LALRTLASPHPTALARRCARSSRRAGTPGARVRRGRRRAFRDLEVLWQSVESDADVAVGSRALDRRSIEARQPCIALSWAGSGAPSPGDSSQRACATRSVASRLFRAPAARAIFARSRLTSFTFHVEALATARLLGYTVREHPVRWRNQNGSKIRLVRDPMRMLRDLVQLAWWQRRKAYHVIADRRPSAV